MQRRVFPSKVNFPQFVVGKDERVAEFVAPIASTDPLHGAAALAEDVGHDHTLLAPYPLPDDLPYALSATLIVMPEAANP